ncbi:FAD-dependent oxidoreductase [Streptomyces sp. NBC_01353]
MTPSPVARIPWTSTIPAAAEPRSSGCHAAAYDIPLRCLLPRDVERVLVAGRCISGDHVAH